MDTSNQIPCGVLLIDKPAGATSHDIVGWARRQYGIRNIGHAGTLDPMATGVLPILVGRATKLSPYLSDHDKTYLATLRLGQVTTTGDIWGETVRTEAVPEGTGLEQVRMSAARLTGRIVQVPPMYSALKKDGQKLVDLARRGIEVEREGREVMIYEIECDRGTGSHEYSLRVHCGKGTYIRTLCEDMGKILGCGGTMAGLRRISVGSFDISQCHTKEEIEGMTPEARIDALVPPGKALPSLPQIRLPAFYERLFRNGAKISARKAGVEDVPGDLALIVGANGHVFAVSDIIREENDIWFHPSCFLEL